MKIESLLVRNFRGIEHLEVHGLGDTIIVAGQNGSGKSCVFDALRLFKTTYGGHQANEWHHFFGEFAIQLQGNQTQLKALFNDSSKPIEIEVNFELRNSEREYVAGAADELLEETIWRTLVPEAFQYNSYRRGRFSPTFRMRQAEVDNLKSLKIQDLRNEIEAQYVRGRVTIQPSGDVDASISELLQVLFTVPRPRKIGIIDYHGPQRHYGRENVQGINLSLDQSDQNYSNHSLYNYNNKYANVKSEMAGNFVKELLSERAESQHGISTGENITDILKELFESFFPDKKFLGPRPTHDGGLAFPVVTASGSEHDLDELSSGEKEILYGYLRMRSSAPRNSIILLDEPELHLNPRLIRGLPSFYKRHLGEALDNQIWLVTHSDALIRDAVGKPGFNIFHMIPCGVNAPGISQLKPLSVTEDLEVVLADLVGDLAAYRPGGRCLIFEGGGDLEFDRRLTSTLFSEELRGFNLVSGTNKARVKVLHEVLDQAYSKGDLPTKFFAITDMDTDPAHDPNSAVSYYSWDVYHIENYLLDDEVIADVVNSLDMGRSVSAASVATKLRNAARSVVPQLVQHKMQVAVNSYLVGAIGTGINPKSTKIAKAFHDAATRSAERVTSQLGEALSMSALELLEQTYRLDVNASLSDGSWRKKLPGREILRQFVKTEQLHVKFETFRNLICSRMKELGRKPEGMKAVISAISA